MRKIGFYIKILIILMIIALSNKSVYVNANSIEKHMTKNESLPIFPKGLEIDNNGNIYINIQGKINVFDNTGEYLYAIKIDTYGDYQMKFDECNNLNVALIRENKLVILNSDGYLLEEKEVDVYDIYKEYLKNSKIKIDLHGNKYELNSLFGYIQVTKTTPDETKCIIYKMNLGIWLLKMLIALIVIVLFPITVVIGLLKMSRYYLTNSKFYILEIL